MSGLGLNSANQIRHCKTVYIKRDLYLNKLQPYENTVNLKRKSRRRLFLLMRSRTPLISLEFRGGFEHPKPPLTVRHCSQASYAVGKQRNTQILVYLPVTYVPGGTTCKAKTLLFTRVYAQGATCIQTRPCVQFPNRILHIRPMPSIVVKTC